MVLKMAIVITILRKISDKDKKIVPFPQKGIAIDKDTKLIWQNTKDWTWNRGMEAIKIL